MGDIIPGTVVSTPSGESAKVVSVHPQGEKMIYTVTFHDGSSAECCEDHLWSVWVTIDFSKNNRKQRNVVMSTSQIIEYMQSSKGEHFNLSIDVISPFQLANPVTLGGTMLPPYTMGALLGDGSFTSSVRFTCVDQHIVDTIASELPSFRVHSIDNGIKEWSIVDPEVTNLGGAVGMTENRIKTVLRSLQLWGKKSHEKFIPVCYKNMSVADRISLLQGLFDTDGTVSKQGAASFTTTSASLAADVQHMLWSLGCTCSRSVVQSTYTYNGVKCQGRPAFTLRFNHNGGVAQFFSLPHKIARAQECFAKHHNKGNVVLRRRIVSIVPNKKAPAQCITIDHPDHLYITDDYVVTHNTTIAKILTRAMELDETDVLVINASDERGIDTFRDTIKNFAGSISFGAFKIVHLEEADMLTPPAQAALKRFMEEVHETVRFILTCNHENKIIAPIKSRCQHFHFKAGDKNDIAEYLVTILAAERVKFDLTLLDRYIAYGYPDIRKIVNLLQQNSIDGVLQPPEIEGSDSDYKFALLDLLERNKWSEARKMLCTSVSNDEWENVYRFLYENINRVPRFANDREKWEEAILIIAEHLYKHSVCADGEVNMAACIIRLGQL